MTKHTLTVREAAAHGRLPRLQGGPGLPLPLRSPGLPMPRTALVPGPERMPRRAAGLGNGVRRARVGLGAGPGCRLALPRAVRAAPRAASSRSRVTAAAPNAQFSLRVGTWGPWSLLGFARPSRPGPPRPWRGRPCAPRRYPAPAPGSSWTRRPRGCRCWRRRRRRPPCSPRRPRRWRRWPRVGAGGRPGAARRMRRPLCPGIPG